MVRHTSGAAWQYLKDNDVLGQRHWEVYDALHKHGPLTANECHRFSPSYGNPDHRHNYNARCGELRDFGFIREVGVRICNATGRKAIVWETTDKTLTKDQLKDLKKLLKEQRAQKKKTKLQQAQEDLKAAKELLKEANTIISVGDINDVARRQDFLSKSSDFLSVPMTVKRRRPTAIDLQNLRREGA
jgi:hypothetical protein